MKHPSYMTRLHPRYVRVAYDGLSHVVAIGERRDYGYVNCGLVFTLDPWDDLPAALATAAPMPNCLQCLVSSVILL
jgi:hypothetical protein